jgi:adenosylcobinamide kinase / adenosylcobinamide-phosphate guanylyltransferase
VSLTLLTGPVRSGKSDLGQRLAAATGRAVTVAVAGTADDAEMRMRIERHRADRPAGWTTLELTAAVLAGDDGPAGWVAAVPEDHVLLVDCLGTLVAALMAASGPFEEIVAPQRQADLETAVRTVTEALVRRAGETIVVSNEAGWGVVPEYAAGRLFRDLLGRGNRELASAADRAYLVVAGRAIDLSSMPSVEELP